MATLKNTEKVLLVVDGHATVLSLSEALEAMATAIIDGKTARIQHGLDSLVWGCEEVMR